MPDSIELLAGLLEQYSPTGEEAQACSYLVGAMQSLGYRAFVDEAGNAVGTIGSGRREIVLLGHIDTVPGFIPVRRENDCIYGRGAVDAKGPLASFVMAGAQARLSPDWRVTVIGTVGEEGNSPGARYLCRTYPAPAFAVIGEPSGWDHVTLGYKGSLWFEYTLRQALAHTAGRSGSACEGAVDFWNRLKQAADAFNAGRERVFDQLTPSLRGMSSDLDGFYETARLKVNLRIPVGMEFAQLKTLLAEIAGPEIDLGLVEGEFTPAFRGEKNTPLVRAFLAGIRAGGGQAGFSLKTGTADLNLVGPAWNCPAVAYGPGDSNLDHTPNENIEVSEYLAGIGVLGRVIEILVNK